MRFHLMFLPGEPFLVRLTAVADRELVWARAFPDKETAALAGASCGFATVWQGAHGLPFFTFSKECDVEPSALWKAGFLKTL